MALHRYVVRNQKREQVGDGDRKFCHRGNSVQATTGRLVEHHGSITAARAAAPTLLGYLARSTAKASKLPRMPDELACAGHEAEIGKWAARYV